MARYIDADLLWKSRPTIPYGISAKYIAGFSDCMFEFSKLIKEQIDHPTADVVEVKHGTWSKGKEMSEYAHCSACNRKMNSYCYGYAHCPLCGAKMDGGKAE